jgi:hypothetical protein
MKRSASIITITSSVLFLAAAVPVFANTTVVTSDNGEGSHTNVNVESNTGGNTICQNGKCTTTSGSGTSSSHVCVNGKCWDASDGDKVNYQSDDGNTKVNINNNTGDSSVSVHNQDNENGVELPTITPKTDKDVKGIMDHETAEKAKLEAKAKLEQAKQEAEAHKSAIARFLDAEMASLKEFFGKFGIKF